MHTDVRVWGVNILLRESGRFWSTVLVNLANERSCLFLSFVFLFCFFPFYFLFNLGMKQGDVCSLVSLENPSLNTDLSFLLAQPAYAEECGIPNSQSSTLVGMMSVGSTFGRLLFGKLGDHPRVNRLYCFQMAMLLIGVADTLSTLTKSYAGLVVYMLVFGVFDGCFVVFLAVLCADIVGVDKVAAGIGIQFFFMAITSIAGPPLAGN